PPPRSTLFPYTTLFRSHDGREVDRHPGDAPPRRRSPEAGEDGGAPRATRGRPGGGDPRRRQRRPPRARRPVRSEPPDRLVPVPRSEEHTSELQSRGHLV